jgi:hypothetical protein
MTYVKNVCNGGNCCEVMVDCESGVETVLSCTTVWPNQRIS